MDPSAGNLVVVHLDENTNVTENQDHLDVIKDKVMKEGNSWRDYCE